MIPRRSITIAAPLQIAAFRLSFLSCFILLAFASGCRHIDTATGPSDGSMTTTTIAGRVTDESGAALSGVAITAAGKTAQTDANGLFAIPNASFPANRAFIIAKKPGYFNGARAAIPSASGVTYMEVSLAAETSIGTINAVTGGAITLPSGVSLSLVSNGVVDQSGTVVNGTVTVNGAYLDPGVPTFSHLFAGNLDAQDKDGKSTVLHSYGVLIAELRGSNGELLQPAPGHPAMITIPISVAQQATAPASIPLWYFDETLGMWKEEGSAVRHGNFYTGTVQHFSFWNYDMQAPYGIIKGRIVCGGVPIPGVVVNLGAYVEGGEPMVITDGAGQFTVRVVANSNAVQLQVLPAENATLYYTNKVMTVNVPANITTDLGDITLDSPCPSYLTGKLTDCNGNPIPGMVVASWVGNLSYCYTADGTFKLIAPSGQALTVTATASAGAVAQPQSVTSGAQGAEVSIPNIMACNDRLNNVQIDIPGSYNGGVLAFSLDGSRLAVLAANGTDVLLLDVATGATSAQLTGAFSAIASAKRVVFSPDGSKILTESSASIIDGWNSDGTKLALPLPIVKDTMTGKNQGSGGISAVFSSDGASIIASSYNGVAEYDIATGTRTMGFTALGSYPVIAGLMQNGSQCMVASWDVAYVYDVLSGTVIRSFGDSSQGYQEIAFPHLSSNGTVLGVTSTSGVWFFNTTTGKVINSTTIGATDAGSYAISPDGITFLGQYRAGTVSTVGLYSLIDGTPIKTFAPPVNAGASTGVTLSADGKLAAAVYANTLRIWKVQ